MECVIILLTHIYSGTSLFCSIYTLLQAHTDVKCTLTHTLVSIENPYKHIGLYIYTVDNIITQSPAYIPLPGDVPLELLILLSQFIHLPLQSTLGRLKTSSLLLLLAADTPQENETHTHYFTLLPTTMCVCNAKRTGNAVHVYIHTYICRII